MTYKELDSAFVAVELAVKDVIVRGAMLPDEERYSLQRIAESYGRRITTPAHIRAVPEPLLGPIVMPKEAWQKLQWCIVGGESGHRARPYDLALARSIIGQCQATGVPVFHKQLGAITVDSAFPENDGTPGILLGIKDPKGGDMNEWPEDLRVREYPNTKASVK